MASTINGTSTGNGGLITTGDDSGILQLQTNETTAVTIDASQNVGIGTSSPTAILVGSLSGSSTGLVIAGGVPTLALYDSSGTTGTGFIGQVNTDTYFFDKESGNLILGTNNTERARIDASGNLLVGTTTQFASSKVTVESTNGSQIAVTHNNSGGQSFFSNGVAAAGTGWKHFNGVSSNNSVQNIIIYGNGNIQNANNSYGALSDLKLKENIVDASPKLEKLCQVRVVNYNLKGEYEQHKQLGVIAQELEQIFPSMVEETADKDSEGNDLGTTTKSVKYSVFVPMLVKAIQEQQALITTLTERITALEAK